LHIRIVGFLDFCEVHDWIFLQISLNSFRVIFSLNPNFDLKLYPWSIVTTVDGMPWQDLHSIQHCPVHLDEQFLQFSGLGFVTVCVFRCA